MSTLYNPKVTTDGLVLYLDASNSRSYPQTGTTWSDLSGNGNTGTLTNGPTFSSANNGVITFDGNDDYCIFNTSTFPSGNSPITIELVFRWSGNGVNTANFMFSYGPDGGTPGTAPMVLISSNKILFEFGATGGQVFSINNASTNIWYHVCAVYNLSQTRLFINGVFDNATNYSTANITLNNGVNGNFGALGCLFSSFGTLSSGTTRRYGTFNGNIAKVALYNRALSATEILQNFNAIRNKFGV